MHGGRQEERCSIPGERIPLLYSSTEIQQPSKLEKLTFDGCIEKRKPLSQKYNRLMYKLRFFLVVLLLLLLLLLCIVKELA